MAPGAVMRGRHRPPRSSDSAPRGLNCPTRTWRASQVERGWSRQWCPSAASDRSASPSLVCALTVDGASASSSRNGSARITSLRCSHEFVGGCTHFFGLGGAWYTSKGVSEEQLLEAWRAGDQAAGGTLLERH